MAYDCEFLDDLALDGRVSFTEASRETHSTDYGSEEAGTGVMPDAVVWPVSTADVSAVLEAANERGVPVTPYAAGTSLERNAVPEYAGISMDMTRMDSVVEVRPDDLQITVEPGILGSAINEAVESEGLVFPSLPASGDISTIGGMVANDASGMKTVKYGEVHDWILELEAVLADGSVITAGSRAVKTSSGYNLKDVIVGSEGTLAVVTEVTLRLTGLPDQKRAGRAMFPTLDDATAAVHDAVRSGVDVATIELIDQETAMMTNAYFGTDLPDKPMVFLEFHANHGIEEEVDFCKAVFDSHGVERFEVSDDEKEMEELWQAREELAFALRDYDPDLSPLAPGDVTVPISKLPEIIRYAKELGEAHDVLVPCFGHAGDGNVHYSVMIDPTDADQKQTGYDIYSKVVKRAIEMGGTATGEHGVGTGKREYLELEHGAAGVETMRKIKNALDPKDTLNPGKMFPETIDGERVVAPQSSH